MSKLIELVETARYFPERLKAEDVEQPLEDFAELLRRYEQEPAQDLFELLGRLVESYPSD